MQVRVRVALSATQSQCQRPLTTALTLCLLWLMICPILSRCPCGMRTQRTADKKYEASDPMTSTSWSVNLSVPANRRRRSKLERCWKMRSSWVRVRTEMIWL